MLLVAMVTTTRRKSAQKLESNQLKGLDGIIERFVHPALRPDPDTLYRARVLIGLLLIFTVICAALCLVLTFAALPWLNQLLGIGICFLTGLGSCLLLLHLQRYGNYNVCSKAIILLIGTAVLAGIGLSGGVSLSPVTQLLMVPPLLAYFIGSLRTGNRASLLSLFVVITLLLLEYAGIQFPQMIGSAHDLRAMRLLTCVGNLLSISAIAFAYELTAAKLKNERDREHQNALALAQKDILTGLANRRTLDFYLTQQLETRNAMNPTRPFVFCCIDLDRFKPINDQYGHKVGDEVLCVIAQRLRLSFRGTDVVARHGGDEFMAMFDITDNAPNAKRSNIEIFADRLLDLIGEPIETSVGYLHVGASLGFALYPRDGRSAEALKRSADSAMYEAKSAGGTAWRTFQPPTRLVPSEEEKTYAATVTSDLTGTGAEAARAAGAGCNGRSKLTMLVDALLHPSLRAEPGSVSHGRVLVLALLLAGAVTCVTATMIVVEPLPLYVKIRGMAITVPSLAIITGLIALLRRRGNYFLCSSVMVLWVYSAVVVGIIFSGGVGASYVTQLLVLAPLLACLFGGTRGGIGMLVASLVTIMLLLFFEMKGFHFYTDLDLTTAKITQPTVAILGTLFCSGWAFIYEFVARTLRQERDQEHAIVERLAYTDVLTGLVNRLKLDEELGTRINHVHDGSRSDTRFSLCYVDLDGFKSINDRYGHAVGDQVLKAIAERLQSCTRNGDLVCRQGGDEFVVLFDSVKDEVQMEIFAQRLLTAIAPVITTHAGPLSIKASLGFAVFPTDGGNEETLKNSADKAMYAAKKQGGGWKAYRSAFPGTVPSTRIGNSGLNLSATPLKA